MKMFIKKLRLEVLFIIYLSLSSHLIADNHNIYETIEQLQKEDLPEDWDGVYRATTK